MDLIVDFPANRRRPSGGVRKRRKSVTFAPTMDIHFFVEGDDGAEVTARWYTEREYKDMRLANKQAVCELYKTFRSLSLRGSASKLQDDEDAGDAVVTGLERFVSSKIVRKVAASKRECLRAVLDEQERQYLRGQDDPIEIGRIAQRRSEWATKRAQTIGLLNSPKSRC